MGFPIQVPSDGILQEVVAVYERGLTVDALRRAEDFAALKHWGGVKPCVLAARIAINAGAPRLASRLTVRARRTDPSHPSAQLQFGFELREQRGPLAAWRLMRGWAVAPEATAEQRSETLALRARIATELRDFATAENLIHQAEEVDGGRAWIKLQRAHLLEHQDRVEEALEVARAAVALHPFPFYRPGVQTAAHLLQMLDRDDDAVELLKQADATLQSGPVAAQLYGILSENGRWPEAAAALRRFFEMSPLLEPSLQKWMKSQQARTAYHLGKRPEAIKLARELNDPFHDHFATKLEAAEAPDERVHLDVSFVRQHFKTCAPATLAALGRYWRMSAEHLKLAEEMCYDGTPSCQQRNWAEQNGWFVREFRVTHESVLTLVKAGIPFAISTVAATSAHMQAVVGFDRTRGTILFRDPSQPYVVEAFAEKFFEFHRPSGPHGMVFLPVAERARLAGLLLPDAEIYDAMHRFKLSLNRHDRDSAEKILVDMSAAHGDHALVWESRLILAGYDANISGQLAALDKLLEFFPNNPSRLLRRLACLRNASRPERLEFLESVCKKQEADPVLFIELARTLREDARCASAAASWLKRALRFRPLDSNAISAQADLLWGEGDFDQATELYRFAASLESFRENLYQTWFSACRQTRHTAEAMAVLEDRFKRFGSRSEQPAITLAWAWRELDQPQRAREIYAEASRLQPKNGYLLLDAARLEAQLRRTDETEALLQAARDKVRKNDWLRAKAEIAELRLDASASLAACREILEIEPLALEAHGGVARALAQREGTVSALAHLRAACARFPHHYGLQRMLMDWCLAPAVQEAEAAARQLLRIDPTDAWARRELSLVLAKTGRLDEALSVAVEAAQVEPRNSHCFSVLGHVRNRRKETAEARLNFRRAIKLSVDNSDALHALLELAYTDKERKEELAYIEGELINQVVTGDGLLAFRELAEPILEPEALLQSLRLAHRERPDLWHAWSALVFQLGHLNRLDEALILAQKAGEHFPHLARIWLDLAAVHHWRKESEAEIAAARRAFEINPAWSRGTLTLTGALERAGKLGEAKQIYEQALQHLPNDAQLHARHGHLLWRLRLPEAALREVEQALRIAPGYTWPWDLLREWTSERGEPERARNLARMLTAERPGEMRVWLLQAHMLQGLDTLPERLAAIDRAQALEPSSVETWDFKAELLAQAERFDEAVQTTLEGAGAGIVEAYVLRGRRAWIEARRGRVPEAVRLMREVLTENAAYVWGWYQLVHWLLEQGALVDAAGALETLQRLRPHDSWVSRELGFLKLKQDDQPAAQKYFAAALQISPSDAHAAQNLFDLQLKAADLSGAAETLQVMQTHQPGATSQALEILLLLRKNDPKAAQGVLRAICQSADPDGWPVDTGANAFHRAGQTAAAVKIFKWAIKAGTCHPQAAAAVIRLLLAQGRKLAALWLFLRLKPGELQSRAAAPLVHGLAELNARYLFRWLLWRRRQVLARNDDAWGQVGYALSNFKNSKQAALWLSDWRLRPTVQPWMLFNLCFGLRQLGRYAEANDVATYTAEKWGHREGSADLRLFLAVEAALSGDIVDAQKQLKQVSIRQNVPYDQDLLVLAKSLVKFQQAPMTNRKQQFETVRPELAKRFAAWRLFKVSKDVRRTFHRAGKVFIQQGGGWRAKLWFGWKMNWQWSLLLLLPATIIFPPLFFGVLAFVFFSKRAGN